MSEHSAAGGALYSHQLHTPRNHRKVEGTRYAGGHHHGSGRHARSSSRGQQPWWPASKAGSEEAFSSADRAVSSAALLRNRAQPAAIPADAADITQEVFIKVFRSIRGFHGDASLRTWLYRIALHEASNQRRWWSRHKRQELTIDSTAGEQDDDGDLPCLAATLADQHDSPYDHAAQQQTRYQVEAALQQLPEVYRTVVILREIEGFAYEEIAEILDVNLGTVKSRLTRGRTVLRSVLVAAGITEDFRQHFDHFFHGGEHLGGDFWGRQEHDVGQELVLHVGSGQLLDDVLGQVRARESARQRGASRRRRC